MAFKVESALETGLKNESRESSGCQHQSAETGLVHFSFLPKILHFQSQSVVKLVCLTSEYFRSRFQPQHVKTCEQSVENKSETPRQDKMRYKVFLSCPTSSKYEQLRL